MSEHTQTTENGRWHTGLSRELRAAVCKSEKGHVCWLCPAPEPPATAHRSGGGLGEVAPTQPEIRQSCAEHESPLSTNTRETLAQSRPRPQESELGNLTEGHQGLPGPRPASLTLRGCNMDLLR